ncbi:outer membrane receptor for iron transport [Alcanivorax sp. MD8A]|uniref:TonB-dependent receptor family protein n=1 Tax=Alcanivorax sp. MD8A TaxID=1177157 RepID=UPI000C9C7762|nr:TonB-dependent receptor [Alcanivorax sp. MD8A]MED5432883.1 TonB-dependent receptor [Pseudomonadota bacterium]MEE2869394.1 TonB-dependent receptor [Pseudomonadota bacterium]PNE03948.1 outer membrane receptor for iron transport [Alcanivorax sp. MD8A]
MRLSTARLVTLGGVVIVLPAAAIAAENAPNELAPITVQEQPVSEAQKERAGLQRELALTPGGVTLVEAEDLEERNVATLGDMLRYVPGMWTADGSTGDGTFLSSRGSNLDSVNYDGNGVKLMIDGLPVTAADGNNHNSFIDPLAARYAVIARGANAMTYGASTLGGAIDFISPTARTTDNQAYLSAGSHGTVQNSVTGGTVHGNLDALVTVEQRSYDGFRAHQEQQRSGVYANTGWQISDSVENRLYLTYVDNDQELAGSLTQGQFDADPYQAGASNETGNFLKNVEKWRVANRTAWNLSDTSSLVVGFSFEDQSLYHPIVQNPFFSLLIDNDQTTFGTTIRYDKKLGNHDLLLGLNYGETRVKGGNYQHSGGVRGALSTKVDNKADNLEVFAMDRWHFAERWSLVYGAQAVTGNREVRNVTVSSGAERNPEEDFDSINPRVGVIYQLADRSELFASVSKLFEAPTLYELEDDVSASDEALDAMQGKVAEVGTRGSAPLGQASEWNWEFTVYYAQIEDEILSLDDPNATGTSLATNVDDTIHAGVEALFGASIALGNSDHRIAPLLSMTWNDFTFDNDPLYGDNQLPVAPEFFIKGEVMYRHANGFYAGPTFDIVDDRYADFANSYKVDGYELLGLRTGLNRDNWEVYLEGRNLTDEAYVANVSARNDLSNPATAGAAAILQAGEPRSFYAGVRFDF